MTPESLDIVRRLAAATLKLPVSALPCAGTLRDVGIDSLTAVDLIAAIESYYGISIAPQDVQHTNSLNDLAVSVDRLTAGEARRYDA